MVYLSKFKKNVVIIKKILIKKISKKIKYKK